MSASENNENNSIDSEDSSTDTLFEESYVKIEDGDNFNVTGNTMKPKNVMLTEPHPFTTFSPCFEYRQISDNDFRSNIQSEADVNKWIKDYSKLTSTSWIIKRVVKKSNKIVYRILYICHLSSLKKIKPSENKYSKSKNLNCEAEINILIKKTTDYTKKKDVFVELGMCAIISFRNKHNHPNDHENILSKLRPTDDIRMKFDQYFECGMGKKQASEFHKSQLKIEYADSDVEIILKNAQINPHYRVIQHWHDSWVKCMDNKKTTKQEVPTKSQQGSQDTADQICFSSELLFTNSNPILYSKHVSKGEDPHFGLAAVFACFKEVEDKLKFNSREKEETYFKIAQNATNCKTSEEYSAFLDKILTAISPPSAITKTIINKSLPGLSRGITKKRKLS